MLENITATCLQPTLLPSSSQPSALTEVLHSLDTQEQELRLRTLPKHLTALRLDLHTLPAPALTPLHPTVPEDLLVSEATPLLTTHHPPRLTERLLSRLLPTPEAATQGEILDTVTVPRPLRTAPHRLPTVLLPLHTAPLRLRTALLHLPTALPRHPTAPRRQLTALPHHPTALPHHPTALPRLPTALPHLPTALPRHPTARPRSRTRAPPTTTTPSATAVQPDTVNISRLQTS